MRDVRFFRAIRMKRERVGQPGDVWIISDGTVEIRILKPAAKELAERLTHRAEKAFEHMPFAEWCIIEGGEKIMLWLPGSEAKVVIANIIET
jgi:hypothetical protein